jgi:hypothetical protein
MPSLPRWVSQKFRVNFFTVNLGDCLSPLSHSRKDFHLKRALQTVGGIAIFVGLILVYNGWFWLSVGSPTIPQIEGRWWAGYYETTLFGRQWCVARFIKSSSGRLQMALLSSFGEPELFNVKRTSSSESFVYLTFIDTTQTPAIQIDAKQLYKGKRYYFGRIIVGRFADFWQPNEDISIRGNIVSWSPQQEFAIEPIGEDKLEGFWKTYVRRDEPTPSPADILKAVGFF